MYRKQNLALGLGPDTEFASVTAPFNSGDRFCFLTDGMTETADEKNDQFGQDRLVDVIRQSSALTPVGMMNSAVIEAVKRFAGRRELDDDITLMTARIA